VYVTVLKPKPGTPGGVAAGFAEGRPVTIRYSGNYSCVPNLLAFYPGESVAAARTPCEIGRANGGGAGNSSPEWILIPAFAGLSIFGMQALGASPRGFPMYNGAPLPTDCGASGAPTSCSEQPADFYSPLFGALERYLGFAFGPEGLPYGVLPAPSEDTLLASAAPQPSASWSTIFVFVFDPNIYPNRTGASCSVTVSSGLANPIGNCLTSVAALRAAAATPDGAVSIANANNPLWRAWGEPRDQVYVPAVSVDYPNANLILPFSSVPGLPHHLPT
jgi:hypothetical protein